MEFPTLGEHCQNSYCNQKDFLPLQCKCGKSFCKSHFQEHCLSGECEMAPEPREVNLKNDDQIFKCSGIGCKKGNLQKMLCNKCHKHYCIEHRFHLSCPEVDEVTMKAKIEQFEAPRRQFLEAHKDLQEKITENIRKALQSSSKVKTASKIHLMRIKQKAIGPKNVSSIDRVYFAVSKPKNKDAKAVRVINNVDNLLLIESVNVDPDLKNAIPVFISSKWSLGRAIDSICDSCNILNENNRMGEVKLRLFRQIDGYCISPTRMDVEVSDLMKQQVLLEGDKLFIDYIDARVLDALEETAQIFLDQIK